MSASKPDQEMLYRYSQKKLSDEEEERVELWLMEDPDGLEDVVLDECLSSGIEKPLQRRRFELGKWFHWVAYPAVLGVAVIGFLAPLQVVETGPITDVQIVRLVGVRSVNFVEVTDLGSRAPILLDIASPLYANGPFSLSIRDDSGSVLQMDIQKHSNVNALNVLLPPEYFSAGQYHVQVDSADGLVGTWTLIFPKRKIE